MFFKKKKRKRKLLWAGTGMCAKFLNLLWICPFEIKKNVSNEALVSVSL